MTIAERIAAARAAERDGDWDAALTHYESAFASLTSGGTAAEAADLFRWIGSIHRIRGDAERAQEAYEASLTIAKCAHLPFQMASALNCLGILVQFQGASDLAESHYTEGRAYAIKAQDERIAAIIDQNLATLASIRGNMTTAIGSYESALARFRKLDDASSVISSLNNLGMAHRDMGDWAAAERSFDEAFELGNELRDALLIGNIELNRADLEVRRGRYDDARESCDRAFEVFTRVRSVAGQSEAYKVYGSLFGRMNQPSLADTHFERASELAVQSGDRLLEAEVLAAAAQNHLERTRNAEALRALNDAYHLFRELGAQAALLDLDRRLDGLENTYLKVVAAWAESIDAKDPYTAGHCSRVADLACRLAENCGFTGRELTWFRMGGFLHDVGKTAVPLEILNKPGKLTEDEWVAMKNHTVAGADIVAKLNFPWEILPIVRSHHERWNGTGYPDGLAGEDIPFTARILCVADVYDALTTARSYRPAMSREEALQIMERDAGIGLDPDLFARFLTILDTEQKPAAKASRRVRAAA
ncbi:MAG TPA: HD domain-containing phosphohydrolase [Longimicrobiales bacterium]|nr:HD domain-containing phosphohydrolase [Longimicrobiales bacterium]